MKNLKRTLALVVVFAMMLSTVAFAAVPADVQGTEYEGDAALLGTLNIMTGDAGGFRPNDTITRAEFAAIVSRVLGLENAAKASGGATNYNDVPATHWAAGYINLASSLQIINGYGDGNFGAEDPVTFEQALKMLVVALGYKDDADAKGGYPVGYMIVAAEKGLTDDVEGVAGTPALRGVVAQLTANSLTVETQLKLTAGDDVEYKEDGTLLEKLDITKSEGVITNADVDDEKVTINDGTDSDTYEVGITDALDLLGYNVEFYYDDDETLIMVVKKDNTELVVPSEDIDEVVSSSDVLTVNYEDKENDEAESVTADATKLYYNTDKVKDGSDAGSDVDDEVAALSLTGVGQWVFVDNDNDDEYDFVFATEYTTYVVDEVNEDDEAVYYKDGGSLDLSDDDVIVDIKKDGSKVDYTELEEWDVLEVAENSAGDYIKVLVLNDTVEGKISAFAGGSEYLIGYANYSVLSNAVDEDGDTYGVEVGDEGIFYLDFNGAIVAANLDAEGTDQYAYGYVITAYDASEYGVENYKVRMLNAAGDEVILDLASTVKVDGTSRDEEDLSVNGSDELVAGTTNIGAELVKYDMNANGEVNKILTADATDDFVESGDNVAAAYNEDTEKLGSFKITEDTIIFLVDGTDFEVYDIASLEDNTSYDVTYYDAGSTKKPKAVLATDGSFSGSADAIIAVMVNNQKILNEDGDQVANLVTYVEEAYESFAEEDSDSAAITVSYTNPLLDGKGKTGPMNLEMVSIPGTIVKVTLDSNGYLKTAGNADVVFATVYDKDSDTIIVWDSAAGTTATDSYTLADTVYVYEHDVEDSRVKVSSLSKIKCKEDTVNASVVALNIDDETGLVDLIVIKTDIR